MPTNKINEITPSGQWNFLSGPSVQKILDQLKPIQAGKNITLEYSKEGTVINYQSQPTGACCVSQSGIDTCIIATKSDCEGAGGTYQGTGTTCSPYPCCPHIIHVRLQITGCFYYELQFCTVNVNIDVEGDVELSPYGGQITWLGVVSESCSSDIIGQTYFPNPNAYITLEIFCGLGRGLTTYTRWTGSLGCINGTPVYPECPFNALESGLDTGGFPEGTGTVHSQSPFLFPICHMYETTTLTLIE